MDRSLLKQISEVEWQIEPHGKMQVPGVIFADETLIQDMDNKVYEQIANVASLPGIQLASFAMPDAHWGYGFPIGGVAAFDPDEGGVISAGGVGFDISCGVRNLRTGLTLNDIEPLKKELADILFRKIPAGVGSTSKLRLNRDEMTEMLIGGVEWAVEKGYGRKEDLKYIEENGAIQGAKAEYVSDQAIKRQHDEMGTLGSGNHYLEIQYISEIYNSEIANAYGLRLNDIMVSIHCGSRGLGHQIGTEFLKRMVVSAQDFGIELPDRELASVPINSQPGQEYLGAMRAGINCALANRQIITHLAREVFGQLLPEANLTILYDVSHNTCKEEEHLIDGKPRHLFIHRKGATRAFGPGNPDIRSLFGSAGQPVLIGGSMGTASYILAGTDESLHRAFGSSCHGAGRNLSRSQALKKWKGREIVDELAQRGIIVRSPSYRGIAEEAPLAYKDVTAVVDSAEKANLSRKVAKLKPIICIKG